jgi:hypothetical protein
MSFEPLTTNHKLARKSIIFAFLSFPLSCILIGVFVAIAAIIYGHLFLSMYKKAPEKYIKSDQRLAKGGLFLGYLGAALSIWIILLVLSLFFGWDLGSITIPT